MSLDLARGPNFQGMTEGTPGDEVVNKCSGFLLLVGFVFLVQLESWLLICQVGDGASKENLYFDNQVM